MQPSKVYVTREDLYAQVWARPMMQVAKDYGVSGNALAKTCRKLGVPVPPRGYWAKEQNGKKTPPKPVLPLLENLSQQGTTVTRSSPAVEMNDPVLVACAEALQVETNRIGVRAELRNPHPAVMPSSLGAARLPVTVSKKCENRALRILDALVKGLEARGYLVTPEGVLIEGQTVKLALSEKQAKTPHFHTPAERKDQARFGRRIPLWDYTPSGLLSIHSESYVWWRRDLRKTWSDTKTAKLEDMLDVVLLGLVALGVAMRRRADEQKAEAERQAELARQRRERERQERLSAARDKDIIARARSYSEAGMVLHLIEAVEQRASVDGPPATPGLEEWLQRAKTVAASLDPLSAGLNHMLHEHDALAEGEAQKAVRSLWDHS